MSLPTSATGNDGLLSSLEQILKFSVNTWHQGFLDKLYSSTNAPGLAAELILATLNTNVHVYQVSPVLTLIEKRVAKELAHLFGLKGLDAGGVSMQGGSAANTTSIVVARNTLFPETKTEGCSGRKFVLFTSAHGHYSVEKAAQMIGLGSRAVIPVAVDEKTGAMDPAALDEAIIKSKENGLTPFYVNATAGTTVLGSFDPFTEISSICKKHNLWFHIDGSWGGSFVFSEKLRKNKLAGAQFADSITVNPHKMLNVPVTCSFLLGADLRKFHAANTLPAGYLFHNDPEDGATAHQNNEEEQTVYNDLADLTLQCGRRGDGLKLYLAWIYYGSEGFEQQINTAYENASYFVDLIEKSPNLILVSQSPPPCLQVCFYFSPGDEKGETHLTYTPSTTPDIAIRDKKNSQITELIASRLMKRGMYMVDYAPGMKQGDGKFFRAVVNLQTRRETIDALIKNLISVGREVVA